MVPDSIAVNTRRIARLEGDRRLRHIVFSDDTRMDVDGMFMAIGTAGNRAFVWARVMVSGRPATMSCR